MEVGGRKWKRREKREEAEKEAAQFSAFASNQREKTHNFPFVSPSLTSFVWISSLD